MESRRIIFLTEGFLNGWLDFDYKTPLSRKREDYIVNFLERKAYVNVMHTRCVVDAAMTVMSDAKSIKITQETFKHYFGLTLPYVAKKTTMGNEEVTPEKIAEWKEFLKEAKKTQSNA